jgi:hypothetical protein
MQSKEDLSAHPLHVILEPSVLHLLHPSFLFHSFCFAQAQTHATQCAGSDNPTTVVVWLFLMSSVLCLSGDVLVHCFSFLSPEELCRCNATCSHFSSSAQHPSLWKYWLSFFGVVTSIEYPPGYDVEQQQNTFIDCFKAWKLSFPHYSMDDVRLTKIWWTRFSLWCETNAPEILTTLNSPATESDLNSLEGGESLPLALRLFYRFHNGQTIPFDLDRQSTQSIGWGLFGGTHYYDSFVNLRFVSLDSLRAATRSLRRSQAQILPHLKGLCGYDPSRRRSDDDEGEGDIPYYEDDEANGPHSNQLLDRNGITDRCSDLFAFAVSAPRPSKVYCIGREGTVYVNTSE